MARAPTPSRSGPTSTAARPDRQRSLTFYLLQSAIWLGLFYPFTLNLSDRVSVAGSYGIAVTVFGVSVVLADWMRRAGQRGPLELMLRRLVYSPRATRASVE
jgi:uncharacterized protein